MRATENTLDVVNYFIDKYSQGNHKFLSIKELATGMNEGKKIILTEKAIRNHASILADKLILKKIFVDKQILKKMSLENPNNRNHFHYAYALSSYSVEKIATLQGLTKMKKEQALTFLNNFADNITLPIPLATNITSNRTPANLAPFKSPSIPASSTTVRLSLSESNSNNSVTLSSKGPDTSPKQSHNENSTSISTPKILDINENCQEEKKDEASVGDTTRNGQNTFHSHDKNLVVENFLDSSPASDDTHPATLTRNVLNTSHKHPRDEENNIDSSTYKKTKPNEHQPIEDLTQAIDISNLTTNNAPNKSREHPRDEANNINTSTTKKRKVIEIDQVRDVTPASGKSYTDIQQALQEKKEIALKTKEKLTERKSQLRQQIEDKKKEIEVLRLKKEVLEAENDALQVEKEVLEGEEEILHLSEEEEKSNTVYKELEAKNLELKNNLPSERREKFLRPSFFQAVSPSHIQEIRTPEKSSSNSNSSTVMTNFVTPTTRSVVAMTLNFTPCNPE